MIKKKNFLLKCEECEKINVWKTCLNCDQYLCNNCDIKIHNKGKRKEHKRQNIFNNNTLYKHSIFQPKWKYFENKYFYKSDSIKIKYIKDYQIYHFNCIIDIMVCDLLFQEI